MAKTLEQINQDFYIQWYLAGREAPQSPVWVEPPRLPQPAQEDEVEQWMQELLSSPDLDDAQDLLDELPLPDFSAQQAFAPLPCRPEERQPTLEPSGPEKPAIWKSISNIVFYAALIAVVIGAVIFSSQSHGSSRLFGFQYFEVQSGSMQSMIPQGSLVITREAPSGEIEVGDVITFLRIDEETVTHQVVEILPDFDGRGSLGFRTKGTENPEPDPDIVGAANVIGVVKSHVPGLGFALRYIADNIKVVFIIFILVILLSIALRVLLGGEDKQRVRQPEEGCGHITKKAREDEQLCRRQRQAA